MNAIDNRVRDHVRDNAWRLVGAEMCTQTNRDGMYLLWNIALEQHSDGVNHTNWIARQIQREISEN